MSIKISRRRFIGGAAVTGGALTVLGGCAASQPTIQVQGYSRPLKVFDVEPAHGALDPDEEVYVKELGECDGPGVVKGAGDLAKGANVAVGTFPNTQRRYDCLGKPIKGKSIPYIPTKQSVSDNEQPTVPPTKRQAAARFLAILRAA